MGEQVYIVFASQHDEERGFILLMERMPVHAYQQGIYGVAPEAGGILDEAGVGYRTATSEEIASHVPGRPVRDPAAARL